jgi:hypothetical protein
MEGHNERHTPVTRDGKLSVVLSKSDGTPSVALKKTFLNDHLRKVLSSGPLTPEQLADILDEPHTRRAWWLDLHTSSDLLAGTTVSDLNAAVARAEYHPPVMCCGLCDAYVPTLEGWFEHGEGKCNAGSVGQPADAPVSLSRCLRIDHAHTIDAGCWELRPYEERRAELKPAPHKHGNGIADHEFDCTCSICWTHNCGAFALPGPLGDLKEMHPENYALTAEQRRDYLEAL